MLKILCAALGATAAASAMALEPMARIVARTYPQLEFFYQKLAIEKAGLVLDGVKPFASKDKFLPGKIAMGMADYLLSVDRKDPRFPQLLAQYRELADATLGMDNDTWGQYYYISTLYRLKQAGLLEQAISPATLQALRQKLDWRSFVRQPGLELINLPTNYYGVAWGIARLRALMGWEEAGGSDALLDKLMAHYERYSGAHGFSDETDGDGRYDRYSILLIAEICERYIETGGEVPAAYKKLLRKSAEIAFNTATADGDGFTMGRSLGPYGETAMLEILAVAAYLGVLTPEEKQYAYAYSSKVAERYMGFWYDPALRSVDLWGKGRRTDRYRGKHRILGENFSLIHQLLSINELWNKSGMRDVAPKQDLGAWLERTRPRFSFYPFSGDNERALAIWRDKSHVFSFSLINGGPGQHMNSPYYPLPFATNVVAGVADSGPRFPQLLAKITLRDGSELLPAAYLEQIRPRAIAGGHEISYRQRALDMLGKNAPVADQRFSLHTRYVMTPGRITRIDTFTPAGTQEVDGMELQFATFSEGASLRGTTVSFTRGAVRSFAVKGLKACTAAPVDGDQGYQAPYGPMKTLVSCRSAGFSASRPLVVSWTMAYR